MAIAPEQFGLKPVMQRVWREGLKEDERKLLAKHFRDIDEDNGPSEERHLMVAQVAVMMPELTGHEEISHATNLGEWFSKPAEHDTLKNALNKYTFLIARDLFRASQKVLEACDEFELFKSWRSALIATYTNGLKPHVATLNYDSFLYNEDFWCHTRDGWLNSAGNYTFPRFNPEKPKNIQLHGSPLFWGKDNLKKLYIGSLDRVAFGDDQHTNPTEILDFTPHIILSDGALKPLQIARSKVLSAYWKELENILLHANHGERPEEIILFGYGGGDGHLNRLVGQSGRPVRVVERREGNNILDGEKFWKDKLGATDVIVDLRKNILTFDEWAARPAESKMEDDA